MSKIMGTNGLNEINMRELLLEKTDNKHLKKIIELNQKKTIREIEFNNIDGCDPKNKTLIESIIILMDSIEHSIQLNNQYIRMENQIANL